MPDQRFIIATTLASGRFQAKQVSGEVNNTKESVAIGANLDPCKIVVKDIEEINKIPVMIEKEEMEEWEEIKRS